jgi:hypothetical protein
MPENEIITEEKIETRTIKDIVNTPFKKAMFFVQILSYILIMGSPIIGGAIGSVLDLDVKKKAGLILVIFIIGEVLFYGSLFFLGKELLLVLKSKAKKWFSINK